MGQQQLILIILGVIVVGIAVAVGITVFTSESIRSNQDNLINDLQNIRSDAYGYYMRVEIMGGGSGTFIGYRVSTAFRTTADGEITESVAGDGKSVTLVATSKHAYGTITTTIGSDGSLSPFLYTGDFR